ncbi:MAG: ABC transporter ATP-binding protein [bacterium]|nr:ABC transporter ATP-binding protein [bacterium]
MSEPLIRAGGLSKSYRSGPRRIDVLDGLDFEVERGASVAIVGDSGVGKSTLLNLLGGLDRADAGELEFDGLDLMRADVQRLADYRNRNVGFVFQLHHLLPEFTALENVELPFRIGRAGDGHEGRAGEILCRLGLEARMDHRPGELSGGEQQRVAIARAVVTGPRLVLADEPTGNLDPATGLRVFELLSDLRSEFGFALVLATHSEKLARACGRVMRLGNGRLHALEEAETRSFFNGLGAGAGSDPML